MSRIAFLAFSINDNPDEQRRCSLFVDSILNQNHDNYYLLFVDCSVNEKKFTIPISNRIQVVYRPIDKHGWHPANLRNQCALMASCDIIAHVNADNIYSANVATTIDQLLTNNHNLLLTCKRVNTTAQQFAAIKSINDAIYIAQSGKQLTIPGDLQAMWRNTFIDIGGYWGGICNGQLQELELGYACREDTMLQNYVIRTRQYAVLKHSLEIEYLNKLGGWIVHLHHKERENIRQWHKKRK